MVQSYFKVGGWPFAITSTDDTFVATEVIPSLRPFVYKPEADEDLLFTLHVDAAHDTAARGQEVGQFDCGGANHGVWQLEDGGYQFVISNVSGLPCCYLESNATFTRTTAVLLVDDIRDQNFGLNNALMLTYAFATADKNTALMHASVVRKNGRGYLCLGKSGTGKSTHTSLWLKYIPETDLMNDDNPVVRVKDGEVIIYGSPWSGKTPCYRNIQAPVGAFIQLKQYPENLIEKCSGMQAFGYLLPSCSVMKWDRRIFNGTCDTLSAILSLVPCYFLRCLPDEAAAQLSYQTVTGGVTE